MAFSVGLTGGIGSGKSTVAAHFSDLGAAIVDTDEIAHALTGAGGAAVPQIQARFGAEFVTADGALDRARMREHVFLDPDAKAALEAILHPMIRDEAERRAQQAARSAPYLIFVVPLLVESGSWRSRVSRLLVVDCATRTQIERVCRRSDWTAQTVGAVIRTQAARARRLDAADDVIVNEGDGTALAARVARLHAHYIGCAQSQRDGPGTIAPH